jgi:hypothetical protein
MSEATSEDLAFPNRFSKESDEIRRRGCIEHNCTKGAEWGLTWPKFYRHEFCCGVPQPLRKTVMEWR